MSVDAVIVGSGPNGLAAAVTFARAGLKVHVYERADAAGGGMRTTELTLPGFRHDVCSAVHPLAKASPFFRAYGLADRVEFLTPNASFAHAFGDRDAGIAYLDLDRTVDELGVDGKAYRSLLGPLSRNALAVAAFTGSSLLQIPKNPVVAARFGVRALDQGSPLWNLPFREEIAPAMITGVAAHAIMAQPSLIGSAAGLSLHAHAHAGGWPIPRGGSVAIADAMIADLRAHGGEVFTGRHISTLDELPDAGVTLLDVTPRAFTEMTDELPARYRRSLENFRYGNAAAKVDFALSGPVPWKDPRVAEAGTVHLGGTRAQIAASENEVRRGGMPENPYVLVSQPSLFDDTRAPAGQHTLWAYTHVPADSTADRSEAIIATIEHAAPGFRDLILAQHSSTATDIATYNPNYIGGDISAGAATLRQLIARPVLDRTPWRTPLEGVYLTGASTVPGPGVHGLSGLYAARTALRDEFGLDLPDLHP